MDVLILQHIACEPPGVYEDVLRERGARLRRVELDEGESVPEDARAFDALIVMGGPMGANDEAEHPWLTAEKRLIAAAVREGVPLFGVCLGAQLLAASLGARVYRGDRPEVGVLPVTLTYAVQFHLEVSQAMACEWAAVPAYAQALESTEGKGAFDRLLASFEAASADLLGHARTLFERWFELVSPAAA